MLAASIIPVFLTTLVSVVVAQNDTIVTGALGNATIVENNPPGQTYIATLPPKSFFNPNDPRGNIVGSVSAVARANGIGLKFQVSFSNFPTSGGPFLYHIHDQPVSSDGNCTNTLAHLDPFIRGETPACDPSLPQTCQVGDLSGRHGKIDADPFFANYSDGFASTVQGLGSFLGNRSITVHFGNTTRITCANFTLVGALGGSNVTSSPTGSSSTISSPTSTGSPIRFTGSAMRNAVPALSLMEWDRKIDFGILNFSYAYLRLLCSNLPPPVHFPSPSNRLFYQLNTDSGYEVHQRHLKSVPLRSESLKLSFQHAKTSDSPFGSQVSEKCEELGAWHCRIVADRPSEKLFSGVLMFDLSSPVNVALILPLHRWIIYGTITAMMIFSLFYFFLIIFQCSPVSYFWGVYLGMKGYFLRRRLDSGISANCHPLQSGYEQTYKVVSGRAFVSGIIVRYYNNDSHPLHPYASHYNGLALLHGLVEEEEEILDDILQRRPADIKRTVSESEVEEQLTSLGGIQVQRTVELYRVEDGNAAEGLEREIQIEVTGEREDDEMKRDTK
ncbi:hypothetical protein G7Y89_g12219 [Cudoniella acicularis]|uniref:superoxide dismutase n=1 Tax=Cudoniella acicularis TaxID=354080 RepID=A0A8H4RBT9_9HELO|nr:hypothetical protein G7Y89_g12219 [Cudoniella acicularis]